VLGAPIVGGVISDNERDPIFYRGWEFFKVGEGGPRPASPQGGAPSEEAAKWQIDELEEEEGKRR
jgi:hypothetical protein